MRQEDYRPANICQAMGLGGFSEDPSLAGCARAIRLLLTPSFHPELCITITDSTPDACLEVRAFTEHLWPRPVMSRLPVRTGTGAIPGTEFTRLIGLAMELGASAGPETHLVLDGMGYACWIKHGARTVSLEGNVGAPGPAAAFVKAIALASHRCLTPGLCRNAIATLASEYGGVNLALDPIPAFT